MKPINCSWRLLLGVACISITSGVVIAQDNVVWQVGASNWMTGTNWLGPAGTVPPEGRFDEQALIDNGGTAVVTTIYDNSGTGQFGPGNIILGTLFGDSGNLEIQNGGLLETDDSGPPVDGRVEVGRAGQGTLTILPGGGLSASSLILGSSNANNSISLSGNAALNISGNVTLGASTNITGPSVDFTAGSLQFAGSSRYTAFITGASHSAISTTGSASLGGALDLDFSGASPAVGQTWNLVDSGSVSGSFSSINAVAGLSLGAGEGLLLRNTATGSTNGVLTQVVYDNILSLTVNRNTGETEIVNASGAAIDIDGYSVRSANDNIDNNVWTSYTDVPIAGWNEAPTSRGLVAEAKSSGSTVVPGVGKSLGNLFDPQPTEFGTAIDDFVFEYTRPNGDTINAEVNYTGTQIFNTLVLAVDPNTGEAEIRNRSLFSAAVDGYRIFSDSNSLNATTWNSLEDQGFASGEWFESIGTPSTPAATDQLAELQLNGNSVLNNNDTLGPNLGSGGLGTIFNTGGTQDLEFQFLLAGESDPRTGIVVYEGASALTADVDLDGDVDGLDFLLIQVNNPGLIPDWEAQYGTTSSTAAISAVPEPGTWLLALLGFGVLGRCAGRKRH